MIVLEPGADEGDLVSQRGIPITEQDDCATIYEKVSLTECEMLDEVLPLIRQGRMPRRKQNSLEATVMPKRRPEDGLIDWRWTTRRLYNWVRALTHPYPGAFSYVCGRKIIIWKTRVEDGTIHSQKLYGTVEASPDGFPLVALQDGHLRILQVECEGHHPASGPEALRTFLQPGSIFHDAARREAQ
jgi:methionyl-tRNA formyltransferase